MPQTLYISCSLDCFDKILAYCFPSVLTHHAGFGAQVRSEDTVLTVFFLEMRKPCHSLMCQEWAMQGKSGKSESRRLGKLSFEVNYIPIFSVVAKCLITVSA